MKVHMRQAATGRWPAAAILLVIAAFGVCQAQSSVELPKGVKAVWDLAKAYREATPTRERICINGLWRWQPATGAADSVPAGDWGYFKVPGPWPGNEDYDRKDCQTVFAHPAWKSAKLGDITAAWYQREIAIPAEWAGRRITLYADCLNSYAAVYVDGKKTGEMRFPGGEVDLTGQCRPGGAHTLSILVIALPLRTVMFSHSDTFGSKEVQGNVERRGLCGDLWLASMPMGPCIADVKVDTSVRRWEITFDAGMEGLAKESQYVLRAQVSAEGLPSHEFTSKPFTAADLNDSGRFTFTASWKPEKLWDTNTPENMYQASLWLQGAGAGTLDVAIPVRFGFREFWINGRDFYLNGSRMFLSVVPLDNAGIGAAAATYEGAKETMLRLKSFGTNFVYGHNYGCEPGVHLSFAEILRAADDVGMLVALPQPHFSQYDWEGADADRTNGYARHAEYYVRVAQNHPAVVAYATSHNATGYEEMHNPDMIDGIQDPRKGMEAWARRDPDRALRAQAIVQRFDPERIVYHHSSGDLGSMYTANFYANFTPTQELDDWFEHWATQGVKPLFLTEYGSPISWDFTMYRGWLHGGRGFGSTAVPWELCLAQWKSQFFGDTAFRITEDEKEDLRFESGKFRAGDVWHHWDYPHQLENLEAAKPVDAIYVTDNWRAFRTWGVSATNCWEYSSYWKLRDGVDKRRKELKVDWDRLQRPGFSPDYIDGQLQEMGQAFERSDWAPDAAGQALMRNNMPLLAYIGGKPEAFTSKDHNFFPGETVEKQLIIINDSRAPVTFDCAWSPGLPGVPAGARKGAVATGEQERIPLSFAVPADAAPGQYVLSATVKFETGESQQDSFQVHVLPRPQTPSLSAKIALFDPKGETGKLLDAMKAPYQTVEAKADLAGYDILVIGKGALTADGPAPDVMRVREGLRVIVFEQTSEALEKRLGFRTAEYGLRQVFKRVPDHPLLSGLDTENLRDWRGEATLLPPRLNCRLGEAYQREALTVEWCGIEVPQLWRCGCRGNVTSVLIEKPARGDFMPILDGGYNLQYSPLMEYREGKGMVVFCQMDVTGRTESDPAADTLVGNILRYVSAWKGGERNRKALYVGDPAGERHLRHAGIVAGSYDGGKLSLDQVLVVGTGGGKKLAAHTQAVGEFLRAGGNVLALGLDEGEANSLVPAVRTKKQEHIASFFEPFGADSLLAGIGPADVHNGGAGQLPLVSGGARVFGDGVLAKAEDANVIFWQLPPYTLTSAEGAAQSFQVDTGDAADGTHSALVVVGTTGEAGVKLVPGITAAQPGQAGGAGGKVTWTPQVGKTYTFAVLIKGVGGPITAHLEVERNGGPYDRAAKSPDTVMPEGKWTDLHMTFKCDKPYPQGWNVHLDCAQDGGRFRVAMFRLYEGDYIPWKPQSEAAAQGPGTPMNLIVNPSFEAGNQGYWFSYSEQYNLRQTYRRASFLVTRALANMGVVGPTPLLSRVSSPSSTAKPEKRWLDGLYVDQPEDWDYPYRSFCW
jgi:hypothetical protein